MKRGKMSETGRTVDLVYLKPISNLPPLYKGRLGGVESRPAATAMSAEHSYGSPPALRPPLPLLTKEGNRKSVEQIKETRETTGRARLACRALHAISIPAQCCHRVPSDPVEAPHSVFLDPDVR